MTAEEQYVAAAYLVVFVFVLVYVLIMAAKVQRLERELGDLRQRLAKARPAPEGEVEREETRVG
ncbi:MAG: hypothetical protein C4305_09990 [Thermoleophilia bacterium]